MRTIAILTLFFSTAVAVGQQQPAPPSRDSGIAPPGDVQLPPPPPEPEAVPAPDGRREGGLNLGDDLDLDRLQRELGPQGRRFLRRNGDRGISFGLDMAERGLNFGLRYAHGQATPDDARRFGIDMGRRGKAFGLEMRERALNFSEETLDEAGDRSPVEGRDAEFQETPGNITIDAPPLPLGADTVRPRAESKIYGRDPVERPVRFRREF